MNLSDALCKAFLENNEDLFLVISDSALVLQLNHHIESICMIDRTKIVGSNFFDTCDAHAVQLSFNFDDIKKLAETAPSQDYFEASIKRNQIETIFKLKVIKAINENQNIYILIGKDITELLKYKKSSSITESYLQSIIENLPQYVYWKDTSFIYQGCNKFVSEYLHLKSPKDIVGKSDEDFGWSKDRVNFLRKVDESIVLKGETITTEDIIPLNNTSRIMMSTKAPLHNNFGKVIGIIGVSIDITEQKRLESIKDDFISNMQHDIRTPFAGISAVADLFRSVYSSKYPEIKSISEIQYESCMQWEKVQNNLLGVIDTKQPINIERFYLQDKIDEVKKLLHATAEVRHLDLILEYPCREETGEISSDKLKTSLILSSLVGNALNFTEKGSVTIKLRKEETFFAIDIIDTGIGIPADKLEYIFEEFSKLNRSNKYGTNFKGVGLGLYRARRDARKIGGKISVKSIDGVGSTFTLILPVLFNVNI